jgi:hypothetical protein
VLATPEVIRGCLSSTVPYRRGRRHHYYNSFDFIVCCYIVQTLPLCFTSAARTISNDTHRLQLLQSVGHCLLMGSELGLCLRHAA